MPALRATRQLHCYKSAALLPYLQFNGNHGISQRAGGGGLQGAGRCNETCPQCSSWSWGTSHRMSRRVVPSTWKRVYTCSYCLLVSLLPCDLTEGVGACAGAGGCHRSARRPPKAVACPVNSSSSTGVAAARVATAARVAATAAVQAAGALGLGRNGVAGNEAAPCVGLTGEKHCAETTARKKGSRRCFWGRAPLRCCHIYLGTLRSPNLSTFLVCSV